MLFIIQQIITFLKLLHSESSDHKIALAFILGFFCSVSPLMSLQGVACLLIALFFRVQFGAFLFSWLMLSILMLPLAPIFDQIGYVLLSQEALKEVYTWAQQSSLLAQTRFYNTVVFGGFVTAVVLAVPLFYIFRHLLRAYRSLVVARVKKSKVYYVLKSSFLFKIVEFYEKYKAV